MHLSGAPVLASMASKGALSSWAGTQSWEKMGLGFTSEGIVLVSHGYGR
jgi:hypothetical protein